MGGDVALLRRVVKRGPRWRVGELSSMQGYGMIDVYLYNSNRYGLQSTTVIVLDRLSVCSQLGQLLLFAVLCCTTQAVVVTT